MAILETLADRGCCTLVTTHHGALKAFAHQHPAMENGSMEFDQKTLEPTYRFHSGIPGSSYAFQIASRLGMDSAVTSRAASFVGEKGRKVEDLITNLNQSLQEYEQKRMWVVGEEGRLKKVIAEYEEKVSSAKEKAKEIRTDAFSQAEDIVARANTLLESTVAEIREHQAEKEVIKKARQEVEEVRRQIRQGLEKNRISQGPGLDHVSAGQEVWIPAFNTRGTVLSAAEGNDRVLVQAGRTKLEIPLSQLHLQEQGNEPSRPTRGGVSYVTQRDISDEVNVRGLTADEARDAIEKYLDDAFVTGLHSVRIIHGKGTGILRQEITRFLTDQPRVKSKRLGDWDEGGIGVTVVELK